MEARVRKVSEEVKKAQGKRMNKYKEVMQEIEEENDDDEVKKEF